VRHAPGECDNLTSGDWRGRVDNVDQGLGATVPLPVCLPARVGLMCPSDVGGKRMQGRQPDRPPYRKGVKT